MLDKSSLLNAIDAGFKKYNAEKGFFRQFWDSRFIRQIKHFNKKLEDPAYLNEMLDEYTKVLLLNKPAAGSLSKTIYDDLYQNLISTGTASHEITATTGNGRTLPLASSPEHTNYLTWTRNKRDNLDRALDLLAKHHILSSKTYDVVFNAENKQDGNCLHAAKALILLRERGEGFFTGIFNDRNCDKMRDCINPLLFLEAIDFLRQMDPYYFINQDDFDLLVNSKNPFYVAQAKYYLQMSGGFFKNYLTKEMKLKLKIDINIENFAKALKILFNDNHKNFITQENINFIQNHSLPEALANVLICLRDLNLNSEENIKKASDHTNLAKFSAALIAIRDRFKLENKSLHQQTFDYVLEVTQRSDTPPPKYEEPPAYAQTNHPILPPPSYSSHISGMTALQIKKNQAPIILKISYWSYFFKKLKDSYGNYQKSPPLPNNLFINKNRPS